MLKVLFVCHGNICRSTMAESMMIYMVRERGFEDEFMIDSAATSREEIGNGPHHGTVRRLAAAGIPVVPHRARQMTLEDYRVFDYIIGMDSENIRGMNRITGGDPDGKFYRMLEFAGSDRDVADPWYTGDFEATYRDLLKGITAFLDRYERERSCDILKGSR
ncbi:MAG: low molecular weight phosphotyrosine protein phosphatase [Lachnospiraceae bacterium]|nr:low molecular weight phosphotyrosine protein phosphatase [Lachnospiraceae bacterium]